MSLKWLLEPVPSWSIGDRPTPESGVPNVYLAGDWTRTGWPATMEGAVRSGYLAAEWVARAAGRAGKFVVPDLG